MSYIFFIYTKFLELRRTVSLWVAAKYLTLASILSTAVTVTAEVNDLSVQS